MTKKEIRFGKNLKILRTRNGLSQQDLADKILVTRQTISIWERNQGKADIYHLYDICNLFKITADAMLYENVLKISNSFSEPKITYSNLRYYDIANFINNIKAEGLYNVIDEDLENFFGIISFDFTKIMVIVLALNKKGYLITDAFYNGFTIVFTTDEEAINFKYELYNIIDSFLHRDNDFIEEKIATVSEPIDNVKNESINAVMKELYGKSIDDFTYYWVDDEANTRGYGNSELECQKQAESQNCKTFTILKNT